MIFSSNDIGDIGETTFDLVMTRANLFRTCMLGAKWPIVDFYIELKQSPGMFFFVQVKSSQDSFSSVNKINVSFSNSELVKLSQYLAPTFLAAVDITNERVFLKPVFAGKSMDESVAFELNAENIHLVCENVKTFWERSGIESYKSNYQHLIS
ncbi:MAG TPA: hypothetical protein VHS96_14820 [Bacteroidia bacterium]|nr:hypothetical protein [Bacteroidia bacterium]